MRTVQVFDWQDMPEEVKQDFLKEQSESVANGTYIEWFPSTMPSGYSHLTPPQVDLINTWLREQGMMEDKSDDLFYVLINVFW